MKKWTSTFRVGLYKCTLTYRHGSPMHAEWDPGMPRELTDQQFRQYRDGRDALLAEVGKELGGSVLVIET